MSDDALHVEVAIMTKDSKRYFYGRLFKREYGVMKTTVWICNHEHDTAIQARDCALEERRSRQGMR